MRTLDVGPANATAQAFGSSFSVERVSLLRELEDLSPDWDRLAKNYSPSSYFVSWTWAKTWWRSYGDAYELFVLVCRNDQQRIIGIAPFYRATGKSGIGPQARSLRLIGDGTDDVDGFGLLFDPQHEQTCRRAFLDWLAAHPEEWDLLDLNSMPEDSSSALDFLTQVRERGWVARPHWTHHCVVELPNTWDGYLQGLSRKTRQTWLRKIRQVEEEFSLRLRRCETRSEIDAGLDVVMDLHQCNWRSRGSDGKFDLASRRDFYRDICRIAGERKELDLWLLELDGVPRAARLGFLSHKTRHAVIAAMDPGFARHGVGTIAEALVIKTCIERGVGSYDFLAGDEPYKKECGAITKRYMNFKAARPYTSAGIALGAEGSMEDGKRWLRANMPDTFGLLQKAKSKSLRLVLPSAPETTPALQRLDRAAGIQLRVVRDHAGFTALRHDWNDQLQQSSASTIFQSWEWMDSWLRAYGEKDLMIIAGYAGQGLIGVLPLYVSAWPKPGRHSLRVLRLMSDDPDDAGGLGMIARRNYEQVFADAAVRRLLEAKDAWDALDLNVLAENAANATLLTTLRQRKFAIRERSAPHLVLPLLFSPDGLDSRHPGVVRSKRKLASRKVEYRRCFTRAEIEESLHDLFSLHSARWQSKGKSGAFATSARADFYRNISASMLPREQIDVWTMSLDGEVVAVEFGLIHEDVRYSLQAGFDPEHRKYKVGMLLDAKIIGSCIESGIRSYDFLSGDEGFKREWGAISQPYRSVRCAPRNTLGALWVRASSVKALRKMWALAKQRTILGEDPQQKLS